MKKLSDSELIALLEKARNMAYCTQQDYGVLIYTPPIIAAIFKELCFNARLYE